MSQLLDLFASVGKSVTAVRDRSLWLESEEELNDSIFIHMAGDAGAQVLCAMWLTKSKVLVASECLKCGHEKVGECNRSQRDGNRVLIDGLNKAI